MGYTTYFEGQFKTDKPVPQNVKDILKGLSTTRRMKRNVGPEYGVEGEFYFGDEDILTANKADTNIIDFNRPPKTQPSLWCDWELQDDDQTIEWNGSEKFYAYVEWIYYIINAVLKPNKIILNGKVEWNGEDKMDAGLIEVINNNVYVRHMVTTYSEPQHLLRFEKGDYDLPVLVWEEVKDNA